MGKKHTIKDYSNKTLVNFFDRDLEPKRLRNTGLNARKHSYAKQDNFQENATQRNTWQPT